MIKTALILTDETAKQTLLGLSVLERQIVSLEKAGIARIFIAGDPSLAALVSGSKTLKRRGVCPRVISKPAAFSVKKDGVLLIAPGAVFGWQGAAGAISTKKSRQLYRDAAGEETVRILPATALPAILKKFFADGSLSSATGKGAVFPGWGSLRVHDKKTWRRARRELLVSMRKPTDGFVSRNFNRYVSLFLTRFFLMLRITPNTISFGNLAVGFLGAYLAAVGGYWHLLVAGLIFQLTSIVDGCDGEVAKLAFRDSEKGAWIDTVCDQLGYVSFFIGLPIGLYRVKGNALYGVMGILTFVAIGFLFFQMGRYVKRRGAGGSMLLIINDIEKVAKSPGAFGAVNRIVFGLSFLFRRDFFAFLAMAFCISGEVWLLQWLITGSVVLMALYMVFFTWRVMSRPVPGLEQ